MTDDCEFCRIINGSGDAHIVYEDSTTIAFLDENPAVNGHTLVVPKNHQENVIRPDEPFDPTVFQTLHIVGNALHETFDSDGFSIFHTTGPLVGNITHAHIHILPRFETDDIHIGLRRTGLDDESGEYIAQRIREKL